jgi:hypothetical protein
VYLPLYGDGGERLKSGIWMYFVTNARSARETGYAHAPSGLLLDLRESITLLWCWRLVTRRKRLSFPYIYINLHVEREGYAYDWQK